MELKLSDGAVRILQKLHSAGFSAYAAGSTVRDLIMRRTPHIYRIATDAPPEKIKQLFSRSMDSGTAGTTIVIENKSGYTLTSWLCKTAEDWCGSSDFTFNSMLYSPDEGIIDRFGGMDDIKSGIIRCTADAAKSFSEHPIHMLRAVRCKAAFDFEIDADTQSAIKKYAVLIKKENADRLLEELNKILLSEHPDYMRELHRLGLLKFIMPQLDRCFGEPQKNKYHIYDVGEHIMHTVKHTPPDPILRWAALLHDTGKPCCSSTDSNGTIHFYGHHRESRRITADILYKLHMDPDSIRDISLLVENHDYRVDPNYASVKRMMSKTGADMFEKLLILQCADNMAKNPRQLPEKLRRINGGLDIYRHVLAEKQPYKLSDLTVNSRDLLSIGYKHGRDTADALKALLDEVIINPELNNRAYLMKRAKEMRRKKK